MKAAVKINLELRGYDQVKREHDSKSKGVGDAPANKAV